MALARRRPSFMNVSAIIVTRGDQSFAIQNQIAPSLPDEWERVVWDNGSGNVTNDQPGRRYARGARVPDLAVYGRYAAIEYTDADLIYVQDDDCVVSDPHALVAEWKVKGAYPYDGRGAAPWGSDPRDRVDHVVCNMPPEFRHDF